MLVYYIVIHINTGIFLSKSRGKMFSVMIMIFVIILFVPILIAHGFEPDTEYFVESERIFLVMEFDSERDLSHVNGGISLEAYDDQFEMDTIKAIRVSDDGNFGRIFGKTVEGNYFYMKYLVDSQDETSVNIMCKVWHDKETTVIIENAKIVNLF